MARGTCGSDTFIKTTLTRPFRLHSPPFLAYFDGRGIVETVRLCFAATGTKFEDNRLPLAFVGGKPVREEFDALKASGALPMGQVPILEVNGTKIFQSKAIQRYVAGKTGLLGATAEESALIDAICESVFDLKTIVSDAKDDAAKEAIAEKLADSFKLLEGSLGGDGFSVGGKLSLADILLYYFATLGNAPNFFSPAGCPAATAAAKASPKVAKIVATVAANEHVAAWEAGREGRNERF